MYTCGSTVRTPLWTRELTSYSISTKKHQSTQTHWSFKHDYIQVNFTFSFDLRSNRSCSIWRTCLTMIRCASRPSRLWPKTSSVCPTDGRISWWVTWALTDYLRPMEVYPRALAKPPAGIQTSVNSKTEVQNAWWPNLVLKEVSFIYSSSTWL